MDDLTKKTYVKADYKSRYTSVPLYYNQRDQQEIFGLGKNLSKQTSWVAHKVVSTDNLDKLALTYYNNPTYWWVIAYFNNINDSLINLKDHFDILKIPAIESIEFKDLR